MEGKTCHCLFLLDHLRRWCYLATWRLLAACVRVLLVGIKEAFEGLIHHICCSGSTGLVGLVVSESPVVFHRNRRREGTLFLFLVFFFHWLFRFGFLFIRRHTTGRQQGIRGSRLLLGTAAFTKQVSKGVRLAYTVSICRNAWDLQIEPGSVPMLG